jgi:hypothetical protein
MRARLSLLFLSSLFGLSITACDAGDDVSESQPDTCPSSGCDDAESDGTSPIDARDSAPPKDSAPAIDTAIGTDASDAGSDVDAIADTLDARSDAADATDAADTRDAADTSDAADTVDTALPPSVITITATDTTVAEPSDTGTFVVSRGTVTSPAITVDLVVDATSTVTSVAAGAIPVDYTLSGTGVTRTGTTITVAMPAGVSSVTVTVTASADVHAEFAEQLVVRAVAGTGYTIGAAATATLGFAQNGLDVIVLTDVASGAALEGTMRQALINGKAFGGTIHAPAGKIDLVVDLPLLDGPSPVTVLGPTTGAVIWDCGGGSFRAIENRGTLTMQHVTVQNCVGSAIGGCILNRGNITLTSCVLQSCTATRGAALESFVAGGITNTTLTGCTIASNGGGVAIDNSSGPMAIGGTTFSGNTGGDVAGACTNTGANTPATVCP